MTFPTIYERPVSLMNVHTHYCPGCTHGTAHRLVAEVRGRVAALLGAEQTAS